MGICTSTYYTYPFVPKRIRASDCSAFQALNRAVNFYLALDLTPSPEDNDPGTGLGAWSTGDLPVVVATQDIDDRGDDFLLVGMGKRIYVLDFTLFHDEFGWDTKTPIYRKITFGPLPSQANSAGDGGASYDPFQVKTFRRLTWEKATEPTDPLSKYRISVQEDGRNETLRQGVRTTQKRCDAKIACRGLTFLVTIEHQADEDLDPTWWRAEWDVRGPRIQPNPHTTA